MNCQEISEIIYRYCDGDVSPREHANVSLHLDKCPVCQHIYQLTLIENDILGEKDDIPALAPAFTSLVMSSLRSDKIIISKSGISRFNRKIWLSSLTTVAAVVALFLYLPYQSFIKSNIIYNDTASISEQSSPSIAYDLSPVVTGQTTFSDSSNSTEPKDAGSSSPINIAKSAPETDNVIIQPMMQAGTESAEEIIPSAAPNISRSFNLENNIADSSIISVRPQNIPERLKFVKESSDQSKTVLNYASLDGTESLQLTLVPYSEPALGLKSGTDIGARNALTISKDILIADKKITVIFSGNLSIEEMSNLANTIKFSDTSTR